MHFHLCKSVKLCASLVHSEKKRESRQEDPPQLKEKAMPSLLKQLQDARVADRVEAKSQKKEDPRHPPHAANRDIAAASSSKARVDAHREFLRATAMSEGTIFTDHESLPNVEIAFARFKGMYPRYSETVAIDTLRATEYADLDESGRVCLDYCGFGLFSHLQQLQDWESASFALADISVNLCSHALYGVAEPGTVECDIRKRIMDYLNIQETDYSMVFTTSRGASFKLLADAYPFETCRRLVTMYDYESESVGWMIKRAKEKGVKISNASFKWSTLRIVSTKLRKLLVAKRRRRGPAKGLFVFPVQSRVSGAKYSYQWMSLAQQNKWHVLLDASALGPKDMDSLGLSLFRPDFIIASFYKVFGADPSGFGCLFIKNTAIQSIQDESGAPATGIVRIIPYPTEWYVSGSSNGNSEELDEFEDAAGDGQGVPDFEFYQGNQVNPVVASFSGPMLGFNKQSASDDETRRLPRIEGVVEEEDDDDDSSVCESVGEVTRSPVFSEDGTDNLFCIDIGPSPVGTASRTSMSEDPFSGPLSGPFSGPFSRGMNLPVSSEVHKDGAKRLENGHSLGKGRASDKNQGGINGAIEDGALSVSNDESEGVVSTSLPSDAEITKKDTRQMELLGPGISPFLERVARVSLDVQQGSKDGLDQIDAGENGDVSGATDGAAYKLVQGSELHQGEEQVPKLDVKGKAKEKVDWDQRESAIRRETEGDFRLLGRRTGVVERSISPILQDSDDLGSGLDVEHRSGVFFGESEKGSSSYPGNEETRYEDEQEQWDEKEPEVICRSLDHADMLGLNKTTLRLRYLINWLISSLLQLHHPGREVSMALVHVYGPQIKYDRGASVAFNLYDCHGKMVHPEVVQMLADKSNISLSIGFLRNLQMPDSSADMHTFLDKKKSTANKPLHGRDHRKRAPSRVEVVTAALSILSNFDDVYRLWVFVAKFLDADFVSKEFGAQQAASGERHG